VLIETNNTNIIIDTGPDFRQQMLAAKVTKLDAIMFTHEHKDHVAGLDDIRAFNYVQKAPVDIYAENRVLSSLKTEFAYIFAEPKYPGVPEVALHIISNDSFEINSIPIIPIRAMHLNLPLLGYRIGDFTYITDANYISPEEIEKIKGSKYFVINGLRRQNHISHFTLEQAVDLIELIKPEKGYITHISHQMGFHESVQNEMPANVFLAYDGLVLDL
jgi:phosphoribosyl 1,2-cyclic phosphate phosphodiesterase